MKTELTFIAFIMAALLSFDMMAHTQKHSDWKEKVKSERIAFITTEIDLTPSEAAKFWPLYNEADNARAKCFEKMMKSYKRLEKAIQESASEEELDLRMQAYLKAVNASREIDVQYLEKYRKVIPVDKVAKLIVAEEKFRRQQIGRLREKRERHPED